MTKLLTQRFEFDVLCFNANGREINRHRSKAQSFLEPLCSNVILTMIAIPSGKFLMGSPETDTTAYDNEKPQHEVSVELFLMSRFPITQVQWRTVTALPQVKCFLDPDPSKFKGGDRPVESVSWYEAVEFCARLSQKTGRGYRLPSEAEWEYACRAGTTTPFYFGETLTRHLANCQARQTDANEPLEEHRRETTPVNSFPPNAFGLHDMHGNVYEWCADPWHPNYEQAPDHGSAWLSGDENLGRVLRGGFWLNYPKHCRSAYRNWSEPDKRASVVGFRVACSLGRRKAML